MDALSFIIRKKITSKPLLMRLAERALFKLWLAHLSIRPATCLSFSYSLILICIFWNFGRFVFLAKKNNWLNEAKMATFSFRLNEAKMATFSFQMSPHWISTNDFKAGYGQKRNGVCKNIFFVKGVRSGGSATMNSALKGLTNWAKFTRNIARFALSSAFNLSIYMQR